MSFTVVKVEPTGTERVGGFRHFRDGRVEHSWDQPVYPPSPKGDAFRGARVAAGVRLTQAVKALGLGPEIICGIECGRYTFADPADWDRAIALLTEATP